ncbi:hypothetical protein L2E82_17882 [Cichorium intybus]|uniref:Uncharacterized protein n=1 Tax=Cichorium intybus TaxID=13427 RepID=A0ACB9F996_CICIN|nr:hypothetical protein L2E82_17882 [Cichorium intybus]
MSGFSPVVFLLDGFSFHSGCRRPMHPYPPVSSHSAYRLTPTASISHPTSSVLSGKLRWIPWHVKKTTPVNSSSPDEQIPSIYEYWRRSPHNQHTPSPFCFMDNTDEARSSLLI